MYRFSFLLLGAALLLGGCALTPAPLQVKKELQFTPLKADDPLYFAPFLPVMTPPEVGKAVFDRVVDRFNDYHRESGPEGVILKTGEMVDKSWLATHPYIEGVIFGYVRESGCCSTDLRLKVRARLHQPGSETPSLQIDVSRAFFFNHDQSTFDDEQARLIDEISEELVTALRNALHAP